MSEIEVVFKNESESEVVFNNELELIEVVSDEENDSGSNNENDSNIDQENNSDFVDWINSFNFQENFNLNFPHDTWQFFCSLVWILIFIICVIVLIIVSRI